MVKFVNHWLQQLRSNPLPLMADINANEGEIPVRFFGTISVHLVQYGQHGLGGWWIEGSFEMLEYILLSRKGVRREPEGRSEMFTAVIGTPACESLAT